MHRHVYFLAAVFLVTTASEVLAINPLEIWLKRNPRPEDNSIHSIASGNGRYVAVGENGLIIASTNGFRWQAVQPESGLQWSWVAFGDGVFVAAGVDGSPFRTNVVAVSSNAIDWVVRSLDEEGDPSGMAFGGGLFVINMSEGSRPWLSSDGRN